MIVALMKKQQSKIISGDQIDVFFVVLYLVED